MKMLGFLIDCVLVGISHYKFIAVIFIENCSKNQIVDTKTFLFWESPID